MKKMLTAIMLSAFILTGCFQNESTKQDSAKPVSTSSGSVTNQQQSVLSKVYSGTLSISKDLSLQDFDTYGNMTESGAKKLGIKYKGQVFYAVNNMSLYPEIRNKDNSIKVNGKKYIYAPDFLIKKAYEVKEDLAKSAKMKELYDQAAVKEKTLSDIDSELQRLLPTLKTASDKQKVIANAETLRQKAINELRPIYEEAAKYAQTSETELKSDPLLGKSILAIKED